MRAGGVRGRASTRRAQESSARKDRRINEQVVVEGAQETSESSLCLTRALTRDVRARVEEGGRAAVSSWTGEEGERTASRMRGSIGLSVTAIRRLSRRGIVGTASVRVQCASWTLQQPRRGASGQYRSGEDMGPCTADGRPYMETVKGANRATSSYPTLPPDDL